jgi:serine/tyrosine/threonine adenylyltransferase
MGYWRAKGAVDNRALYTASMRLGLNNQYSQLPPQFYSQELPQAAPEPKLIAFNSALARDLGLNAEAVEANAAQLFSGNALPEDATPIAMAYAGHQFGQFVPSLGDGRALLLGELHDKDGVWRDIHLKGSGRTAFSRSGDGRAALGPMLREYLISEAMHAMGIPTTRSLAVIATGEQLRRESLLPGAVLVRVAASHVRVGTFQYFASRGDLAGVQALFQFCLQRHYPEAMQVDNSALAFLELVSKRQAELIANWMLVGFIHGVMNTDNMAVSGETIDYGPCAFMDGYDPGTVFSSIDRRGRYAYGNQPTIAQWNLTRLAETLLSLIHRDGQTAIDLATGVINQFMDRFDEHFLAGMRRKLGLTQQHADDAELISALLQCLRSESTDFTLFFDRLSSYAKDETSKAQLWATFQDTSGINAWLTTWAARCAQEPTQPEARHAVMLRANPVVIPRNHLVEAALQAAGNGDLTVFTQLLGAITTPYSTQWRDTRFSQPPQPNERVLETFCGT